MVGAGAGAGQAGDFGKLSGHRKSGPRKESGAAGLRGTLAYFDVFYDEVGTALELKVGAAAFWTAVRELVSREGGTAVGAENGGFFDGGVHLDSG
ncbi:hypothetical protein SAMN02910298_02498 [Pseudobutyrivibrio sp. YE44]|nr:hypothetical protein SAMN02910298_02498 [Pseudobutyrivibrio sp. YE44]